MARREEAGEAIDSRANLHGDSRDPIPESRLSRVCQVGFGLPDLALSSCAEDRSGHDSVQHAMQSRTLLAALILLLFVNACRSDPPPLPDRRYLTGSDWISGGSRTSYVTGGEAVVIENLGEYDLRIGSGPDAQLLAPGETYQTDGTETEIFNPAEGGTRVLFHAPDTVGSPASVEVLVKHGSEARRIHATHKGGAVRVPVGTQRVIDDHP